MMIFFIDFDGTIADTSVRIHAETEQVYIVSGNVGSTIKKAIKHFNIPVREQNVYGYRKGMPMENLRRKISVIRYAIHALGLENRLDEIIYIGDEPDDATASKTIGINFRHITHPS